MADGIATWLEGLGLGKYAEVFADNEIEFNVLPLLGEADLEKLGLPMGPRKRLLAAISSIDDAAPQGVETPHQARPEGPAVAERRQVTVLFCDLVGSTELSRLLDPEDLREVVRRYQDTVVAAMERHCGHVANFVGDGIVVYFGWPRADEDQAQQAVRAGLGAVAAVASLALPSGPLRCRIGIASGQVVIGDLVGDRGTQVGAIAGETPNLAARVQALAEPGQVLLGGVTRRLIGNGFLLERLGPQLLKGIDEPVEVYHVVGEQPIESRFEASTAATSPFVGRAHELALLMERWDRAERGEGQVVLLSGEAGIGKSRLVMALYNQLATVSHLRLRYQCAPQHANSALYPVIRQLEWAAGFEADDPSDRQLDKLEALLRRGIDDVALAVPLIAALLSLPTARYRASELAADERKERTLQALVSQLYGLARQQPVLFLFEDAHWIDPTSQELLTRCIARLADASVLMVVTHRPEYKPAWTQYLHVMLLTLSRLRRDDGASIARAVATATLPDDLVRTIVARADGVPLFIEELTKSVVEAGAIQAESDIPATLQASLMARLDRLGEAKEVAQAGAVIGRQFDYRLLAAAAGKPDAVLCAALDRLTEAGLMFASGTPPEAYYSFKHALVQDVAYESLLRERRRQLHLAVARELEQRAACSVDAQGEVIAQQYGQAGDQIADARVGAESGAIVTVQPELIAHHLTEGDLIAEATPYWTDAGERALERSANPEAMAHLSRALDLLRRLPEGVERDRLESRILMPLGNAVMAVRGTAHPEVNELFQRARQLGANLTDGEQYFNATWNLWLVRQSTETFAEARALGEELIDLAKRSADPGQLLQANHAGWATGLIFGELDNSDAQIEQALSLYHVDRHHGHAHLFGGHDPAICGCAFSGIVGWLRGDAARSTARIEDGLHRAERRDHPMSRTLITGWGSLCSLLHGDHARALELAELTEHMEHEFEFGINVWIPLAHVARAGVMVATGDRADGAVRLRRIVEAARRSPSTFSGTVAFSLLAVACHEMGDHAGALAALDEGIAKANSSGEVWWLAELLRLRGETLLNLGKGQLEAEYTFGLALETARRQNAVTLVTRSIASLSRLMHDTGRAAEADELQAGLVSKT